MKKRILDTFLNEADYNLLEETNNTLSVFDRAFNKCMVGLIISFICVIFGIGRYIYKLDALSITTSTIRRAFSGFIRIYYFVDVVAIVIIALVILIVFLKDFTSSIRRELENLKRESKNEGYDKSRN